MNRYGAQAMKYWREEFPDRFSQINDPQTFFTALGQQVAAEIADLTAKLTEQEPTSATFMANLGSQRTARTRAEEIVLARLVYLTEETSDGDPQTTSDQNWTPLVEDPANPWWQAERDRDSQE